MPLPTAILHSPTTGPISIVLVDDNPLTPDGVVALIRADPGFRVLATSANVEEALELVQTARPDVVLLKIERNGDDTLTIAGALHGAAPGSRVIVMGLHPYDEDVASFVRAGVSGFLMADASADTLLETIRAVAHGNQRLPAELTGSLFGQLKGHGVRGHPKRMLNIKRLTARERAVTDLIAQGLSNKQIAARLQITLFTVKGHVHNLLAKLDVNSRLEVAASSWNGLADGIARSPRRARPQAIVGAPGEVL